MLNPISTIWVFDDHQLRIAGVIRLLEPLTERFGARVEGIIEFGGLDRIGQGSAGGEASDVGIFYVGGDSLADPSLRQTLDRMLRLLGERPLVVLSDRDDETEQHLAASRGVRGYIPTTMDPDVAIAAIVFVSSGGTYLPSVPHRAPCANAGPAGGPEPARDALDANVDGRILRLVPSGGAGHADRGATGPLGKSVRSQGFPLPGAPAPRTLTPRENDVLRGIQEAMSNKEIALELDLAVATVKIYVGQLMRKMGARNRTQLALLARSAMPGGAGMHERTGRVITLADDDPAVPPRNMSA